MKKINHYTASFRQLAILEEFCEGLKVPKNYIAASKKIAILEKKKDKIYKQIEAIRETVDLDNCKHPIKHLTLEETYTTDTMGLNGTTTHYVTCTICNKFKEYRQ